MAFCFILKLKSRCFTCTYSFTFLEPFAVTHCHSLSLVVPLVVIRCTPRWHSLSLDVPIVCFFINNLIKTKLFIKIILCKEHASREVLNFSKKSVYKKCGAVKKIRERKNVIKINYENLWSISTVYRISCPEVFCKTDDLKNFAKLTGKHLS